MDYKIVYSNLAVFTLDSNLSYLQNNWPKISLLNFLDKEEKTIDLIKNNPTFFPLWKENLNIRKAIIVKQITLFYEVKNNVIEILLFWNNYQNPKKLIQLIQNG